MYAIRSNIPRPCSTLGAWCWGWTKMVTCSGVRRSTCALQPARHTQSPRTCRRRTFPTAVTVPCQPQLIILRWRTPAPRPLQLQTAHWLRPHRQLLLMTISVVFALAQYVSAILTLFKQLQKQFQFRWPFLLTSKPERFTTLMKRQQSDLFHPTSHVSLTAILKNLFLRSFGCSNTRDWSGAEKNWIKWLCFWPHLKRKTLLALILNLEPTKESMAHKYLAVKDRFSWLAKLFVSGVSGVVQNI